MKVLVVGSLLLVACGSKGGEGGGDAASCPAFEMKVDGQPVTGFTHKLAFTHKQGGEQKLQVQWFNHDKATCEDVTSMKGRQVPDGEVTVAAMAGGKGVMGKAVIAGSHTEFGVDVELVGDAPKNAGDKVAVCVREAKEIKPMMGPYKGKTLTVKGLLDGSWCGFMDWDPN